MNKGMFSILVPSGPRHLVVEFIHKDPPTVRITWQKPQFPNGDIHGYRIYWGPKSGLYQLEQINANQQSYVTEIHGKLMVKL